MMEFAVRQLTYIKSLQVLKEMRRLVHILLCNLLVSSQKYTAQLGQFLRWTPLLEVQGRIRDTCGRTEER